MTLFKLRNKQTGQFLSAVPAIDKTWRQPKLRFASNDEDAPYFSKKQLTKIYKRIANTKVMFDALINYTGEFANKNRHINEIQEKLDTLQMLELLSFEVVPDNKRDLIQEKKDRKEAINSAVINSISEELDYIAFTWFNKYLYCKDKIKPYSIIDMGKFDAKNIKNMDIPFKVERGYFYINEKSHHDLICLSFPDDICEAVICDDVLKFAKKKKKEFTKYLDVILK